MDEIKQHIQQYDRFAKHSEMELLEVGKGTARAKMEIQDLHRNSAGTVHGGAIFTLADFAFAGASNSHGNLALALNVNIAFVKAAYHGTLYADAKEETLNPKIGTYHIRITDDDGDLVAFFHGMSYRKKESLVDFAKTKEA